VTLVFALAASAMFGIGASLLLNRDLVRVVFGIVLISQAATLTLIAAGLSRGAAPIYPLPRGPVSDPLSQAMALTAIVIGLAVTALLLAMVLRVAQVYRTEDIEEVAGEEVRRTERRKRRDGAPVEEDEEAASR
jgi:multicomponent Na+:H+ antiporter subunit C